eukprot:15464035-Alexandrium_andersonii.AAC.1
MKRRGAALAGPCRGRRRGRRADHADRALARASAQLEFGSRADNEIQSTRMAVGLVLPDMSFKESIEGEA